MAEALLRHKMGDEVSVRSAGVFAADGSSASVNTTEVLKEKGIHIEHSASSLTEDLVSWATYILTMTESHKHLVCAQFQQAAQKTFTLSEFVNDEGIDVMDPFGGSVEMYRHTREELTQKIDKLIEKLQ